MNPIYLNPAQFSQLHDLLTDEQNLFIFSQIVLQYLHPTDHDKLDLFHCIFLASIKDIGNIPAIPEVLSNIDIDYVEPERFNLSITLTLFQAKKFLTILGNSQKPQFNPDLVNHNLTDSIPIQFYIGKRAKVIQFCPRRPATNKWVATEP